jgi:short-subunit dehydrogenase
MSRDDASQFARSPDQYQHRHPSRWDAHSASNPDDMSSTQPLRPGPIRSAFVLGSTSLVAQAICHELARRGCRRFHLVARNSSANQLIAETLAKTYGAEVSLECTNLLDDASLTNGRIVNVGADFDLYLITAGSLGDAERARGDAREALAITAANYTGLLPWLTAIATPERLARPGRLWVFSSVAGDRGRPSNYVYGAAKAALTIFCEGLLLRCHGKPFAVRILKAGFMATPMTEGKAPAALCASPEAIAKALVSSPNRRGVHYLPHWWIAVMSIVRVAPKSLLARM